jgi:hypothetical protein
MTEVWKYTLPLRIENKTAYFESKVELMMQKGAKILHVDEQEGIARLWAQVDINEEQEQRNLLIFGTGHIGVRGSYIGSVKLNNGTYMFHIFEEYK